jgi:hypothetical protein
MGCLNVLRPGNPMRFFSILLLITSASSYAEQVDNFVLLDEAGDAHELYYHQGAKAIVLMSHSSQCDQAPEAVTAFNQLQASLADKGVVFFLVNSVPEDDRSSTQAAKRQMKIQAPILNDETQLIGESLDFSTSNELLVVDTSTWQTRYRGHPDGAMSAINAVLQGDDTDQPNVKTDGCEVPYLHNEPAAHQQISYSKEIAPILKDKCVVCHTEGGLGPWAMSDYNMVLGFSPMIREVLRTKRMPPWHADPHIGVWQNDISLSSEQLQTLVHWIEAGSPRGEGSDPLADTQTVQVEWPLGQPDLILDIPPHTVPVSGVVDYQFPTVANPLDKGIWVKAATVVPGDREVVHHILAGTVNADASELRRNSGVFDNYLIGYAPGNESNTFPEATGVYIPPGGDFLFQLHYTPVGRETVDKSRIGLYFHEEQPENFYRQSVVINPAISIPPNEARHEEVAYYEFDKPALLHDLVPHAHYRGVASKFELINSDGHRETLLSVPNYDFNWQRTYEFVEPRRIEAGSRLIHTTWYDNSAANPGNPDPDRAVPWGLQSWDEMLYGAFSYTYVDETTEAPIHDAARSQTAQFVGFLDKDLNGKVSWRELPRDMKKRLVQGFKAVDANGDGSLDMDEMHKLTLRQRKARAQARLESEAEKIESAGAR